MTITRSCPICGQQKTREIFRPKVSPGPVSKCINCGMVYVARIENLDALIFDGPVKYGRNDPKVNTSTNLVDVCNSWEFKHLPDKEIEMPALRHDAMDALKRVGLHTNQTCSDRIILDFGSGWGFFLAVAKELGWTTYGLEPLPASAVYARATFGLNITTDTLHEDTFQPDFFDVITAFQVFEHLPNPQEDIQYLCRMLRESGIVLIEVPNFKTWSLRIMKSRHRHFVEDHINFFSIETLDQLLVNNGFRVIDHFHSTRHVSVRHLVNRWFRQYLPVPVADLLQRSLQKTSLWEHTIGLNIGDIITVIGRKL